MGTVVTITDDGKVAGYLTLKEFADKNFVTRSALERYIAHGRLKTLRIGNILYIPESESYPDRKSRCITEHYICDERPIKVFIYQMQKRMNDLGMTQDDIIERLGLKSASSISRMWNKAEDVQLVTFYRICVALNVSAEWIIGRSDTMYPGDFSNGYLSCEDFPRDEIAKRLKNAYRNSRKTVEELCSEIGMDSSLFGRYITTSGKNRNMPQLSNAIKITKVLDISLDWLLGFSDMKNYKENKNAV